MAEFSAPSPGTEERLSFFNVMIKAYTGPSQSNFQSLARNPGASAGTAYLWVAVAAAVGSLITAVLSQIFQFNPFMRYLNDYGFGDFGFGERFAGGILNLVWTVICGVPVAAVVGVIAFAIFTGIMHLISGLLGGQGDYGKLAYIMAAVQVPFTLISSILSPIPYLACLVFLIGLYVLVLQVLALDGVYLYGIPKAILALLIPIIVICIIVACIAAGFVAIFATAFREVFDQIPSEIYP
jgi:hypothetical protein